MCVYVCVCVCVYVYLCMCASAREIYACECILVMSYPWRISKLWNYDIRLRNRHLRISKTSRIRCRRFARNATKHRKLNRLPNSLHLNRKNGTISCHRRARLTRIWAFFLKGDDYNVYTAYSNPKWGGN